MVVIKTMAIKYCWRLGLPIVRHQQIARWLGEVLRPVVMRFVEHTLQDTLEFCDNLQQSEKAIAVSSSIMCSFDTVSLFRHIPLKK